MKKSLLALTVLSVCSAAQAIGPTLQYNDEVAVGENVTMTGLGNVYIGRDTGNNLGLQNATTVGQLSYAGGDRSVAVGSEANANATNSVAVGANTYTTKDNSVAIGYKSTTVGASAVAIGRESNATHDKERQIVNLAAGEVSATSTDAINGSQLYTIAQAVENVRNNIPQMCLTMHSSDNNIGIEMTGEDEYDFTLNKDLTNLNTVTVNTSVTVSKDSGDTTNITNDGMNIRYYDNPNGMEYNTTYNHNGLTIKRNDGDANAIDEISLTTDGLNNGGKRIINVKEGSNGTDAVNVNQLNKVREENQQITEKVTRNGDKITQLENDVVKNTTKITENTKAIESNTDYIKAIEKKLPVVEAGKNTTVTTSTDANGKITYTVSSKDFQPEINKVDDKANKNATDIGDLTKRVVTNEGNITNNSNRISTLEKQIPEVDAGTNVEVSTTNVNGKKTFTVSTKKDVDFNKVTVGDVVVDNNGINAGNQTIINVKDGVNGTDAVNVNQLKSVDNKVNQNAQGIAENKQAIASIDKRHSVVEQGKNTKVTSRKGSNGETIYTVSTADDLTVKSVTFVDGPVINNNGINANNTKVTNVKEGTADTDAVNVAQLNRVKSAVNGNTAKINKLNTRVDGLDRDVRKNRKRADAGTASVAAMANIPQVYLPGKSGVAVGVGYKHGQSAIAVGYSKASDNSKHIVKLSVGADSQKDVTLGAGYMYQW